MLSEEKVTVVVDGKRFTGWESITVKRSVESMAASFDFSSTDNAPDGSVFSFTPGMAVKIQAGADDLLTGYINDVEPEVSGESHSIKVSGRCKTQDLVDCSAEVPSSSWAQATPLNRMCYDLVKPFGIQVKSEAGAASEKVPKGFMLNAGESPQEAIQRLCADRALLAIGNEAGQLVLTTSGALRAGDSLRYGVNVLRANGRYGDADRFSKYVVKGDEGTDGGGWTESKIAVSGGATDGAVKRYRLKILKASEQMTPSLAKKKAAWEAQVRAGKAGEVSCTVQGWRQTGGALWRVNTRVVVDMKPLKVFMTELLITEISYKQDADGGTTADMVLKRPDIYAADPTAQVKKSPKKLVWE